MTSQMFEKQHDELQKNKKFPWVLWSVVCIVVISIIAFTVIALLILRSQGSAKGVTTLTIISIVLGIIIALLSLLISFLQWHHPKPSTASELSTPSPSSKLAQDNRNTDSSSAFPQHLPASTPTVHPNVIARHSVHEFEIDLLRDQVEQDGNTNQSKIPEDCHIDWGEAPFTGQLFGRDRELAELKQWIVDDHCRVISVVGIGGIGKTALAAKLVEQIKDDAISIVV